MSGDEPAAMASDAVRRDAAWGAKRPAFTLESWGLILPLVFACNVAVATLAWLLVGFLMR
jgi:hypothetical protein